MIKLKPNVAISLEATSISIAVYIYMWNTDIIYRPNLSDTEKELTKE